MSATVAFNPSTRFLIPVVGSRPLRLSPTDFGAWGNGFVDDTAALTRCVQAAVEIGGIVDGGARTYRLTSAITVTGAVRFEAGTYTNAVSRCFLITGAQVRFRGTTITRTGGAGTDNGSAITWNATDGVMQDCRVTSSTGPALQAANGTCARLRVTGGRYETSMSNLSDNAAILVAAGSGHNYAQTFENLEIRNTGRGQGIVVYNCSECVVRGCDVRAIRRHPLTTVTGSWTNTTGTVWRTSLAAHRTDCTPNAVYDNGTEVVEDATPSSTTPASNRYTTPGDGFLYLNLGGTDPNTRTITTTRTSGYGILFYSASTDTVSMEDNLAEGNYIEDTDSTGIYFQTLLNTPRRNRTSHNRLVNVCLEGVTVDALPTGGIGWFGGVELGMVGDAIQTTGASGKAAPGIRFKASPASPNVVANVVGVTVRGATAAGVEVCEGGFTFTGCDFSDNSRSGLENRRPVSGTTVHVAAVLCRMSGNTQHGISLDNLSTTQVMRLNVFGGRYESNGIRGIYVDDATNVRIVSALFSGNVQYGVDARGATNGLAVIGCNFNTGQGLIVGSSCTNVWVTACTNDASSGTKFNLAVPYRIGGNGTGEVGAWVGAGTPEGVITAPVGSTFQRTDGGAGTSFYVKESGTGNTGWVGK